MAVELLEYLRDDYRTTPIVTFATAERGGFPTTPDPAAAAAPAGGSARRRPLNAALSAAGLADYSSLVVPVDSAAFAAPAAGSQARVTFPSTSDYNTSAVVAAAIETATLPYRLLSRRDRMGDLVAALTASGERRSIPLCSLQVQVPLDWHRLVRAVEAGSPQGALDAELASRYLAELSRREVGQHPQMVSLTPTFGQQLAQLLPSGAAWEEWDDNDDGNFCDVFTVRGLDLRLRRGVCEPPSRPAERSFRAHSQCSTFVGGALPLPLCFPPVLRGGSEREGEPEPEPEPEPGADAASAARAGTSLHEAAVATRLTTRPASLFPLVHGSQQIVRQARLGHDAALMAALGGAGAESAEHLAELSEKWTGCRDELLS